MAGGRAARGPNGSAVAAALAAGSGLLVLGVVVVACELSPAVEGLVSRVGEASVPGAERLGAYAGKQVVFLVGWLAAWLALHLALRGRDLRARFWMGLAFAMVLAALVLVWPPVWHLLKP